MLGLEGFSALSCAIRANSADCVQLLAPVTSTGLFHSLREIAGFMKEVPQTVEEVVKKCIEHNATSIKILKEATSHANVQLLKMITKILNIKLLPTEIFEELLKCAIESDCPETCQIIMSNRDLPVQKRWIQLAEDRGKVKVLTLLDPSYDFDMKHKKNELKSSILSRNTHIFDQVPKSVEVEYNRNMDEILALIEKDDFVSYDQLKNLHVAEVHYETECNDCCKQKTTCERIRETVRLVEMIARKLGQINPVFENMGVLVVGSLKEKSRTFHVDEVDMTLTLADEMSFDENLQAAKISPENSSYNVFKPYRSGNDQFDSKKFYIEFLTGVHAIVSQIEKDEEWNNKGYTMDRPTTSYDPCTRCMSGELTRPECRRCCHEQNCKSHDTAYTCGCRVFTRPSLTRSKIGAVLHLQWTEADGTKYNLDCDVC